jgi:hypothetical protein
MNQVLGLGSRIDQSLTRTSYAFQISIVIRINSRRFDEIIEAISRDSFRVETIRFLAFNIPDLVRIVQDKFNMTFHNAKDRMPVVPCRFYSDPTTSMIQDLKAKSLSWSIPNCYWSFNPLLDIIVATRKSLWKSAPQTISFTAFMLSALDMGRP